jgi:ELWxxDGT repeat protein
MTGDLFRALSQGRVRRTALGLALGLILVSSTVSLAAETWMVRDIKPTGSSSSMPSALTRVGRTLYFTAIDGIHARELWRSDGTRRGTRLVKDIDPSGSSFNWYLSQLARMRGTLYFIVDYTQLWKSDGTAAGTRMVKGNLRYVHDRLTNVGGELYFTTFPDGERGELWRSDGTRAGTRLVKAAATAGYGDLRSPTKVGDTVVFIHDDGIHGLELWRTDGTRAGTRLLKDINQVPTETDPYASSHAAWLNNVGGTLYFTAWDGSHTGVWKSDGTTAGTKLVAAVEPRPGHDPGFTILDGTLYFTTGWALFKSDGTAAGTVRVTDPRQLRDPSGLANVGGVLYFSAKDRAGHKRELWRSDGTAAGTRMVKDINPVGASNPADITDVGGVAYFTAADGVHGVELWTSDGTARGTRMVRDINPVGHGLRGFICDEGICDPIDVSLTVVGDILYFAADDGTHGWEIWGHRP